MSRPNQIELTAEQLGKWSQTRVALTWFCPAFTHVFYTMMDNANSKHIAFFTKDVPIAATDGACLLLNPDRFFKYDLAERVFICVHEIMHCIWNHCGQMHVWGRNNEVHYPDGSSLPYDQSTMNKAMDFVINDALIEAKVGKFNTDWLHRPDIATGKDAAIDAYKKVYKAQQNGETFGDGFDELLAPGTTQGQDPGTAASSRSDIEWKTAVAAGINAARAQGKLPGNLERLLGEILDPKVDWKEHIRALMTRKVGSGGYSWSKPDRRLIVRDCYAPGRTGFGCGTVVVGIDTSGSIGDTELNMFMAEMAGILEDLNPEKLVLVWCDAEVNRVDEAEDVSDLMTIRAKGAPGGGGTSFIPVFDHLYNENIVPDALVYLTDGLGCFPSEAPPYNVIWGSIHAQAGHYPFGDVVMIPKGDA